MAVKLKELPLLIGVAVLSTVLAFVGVHEVSFLTLTERTVADFRTSTLLPPEPQDPDIVIVPITEDTLTLFPYRSPVDRGFLANLLKMLALRHPKAIALDVLFDQETEPDKDALLKETLRTLPVPLAVSYVDDPDMVDEDQRRYLDDFVPQRLRIYANLRTDPVDGVVRGIYPGKRQPDGSYVPGFARGVAALAGVDSPAVEQETAWRAGPDRATKPFKMYPAHTVAVLPPDWFEGKIVLIGEIVTLTDRHRTPFSTVYSGTQGDWAGIEIQAQGVSQVLHGRHPRTLRTVTEILMLFALAAAGVTFGKLNLGMIRQLAVSGGALAILWPAGFALFYFKGVMIPLVEPSLAFLAATWGTDAITGREAKRQREFINGAFSRYLNPSLVKQLADDPNKLKLGGEMREMTLLFCDIRGFTTISEKFDAQGLTRFINRFLTPMTDLIMANGGTIDKYMGDAIMAFWNAPLDDPAHAEHGCRAALGMRSTLIALNERWAAEAAAEGHLHIPVNIGIGINTGVCCVGNVGSDQRFDYSVLGDDVNLASRLEGQSKTYHLDLVIGARTAAAVPMLATLELDSIMVKGKTEPVRVYTVVGDEAVLADPAFLALRVEHEAMLAAFRAQQWAKAKARLSQCLALSPPLMMGFYEVYEERVAAYEAAPPPSDWDGVFVALTK